MGAELHYAVATCMRNEAMFILEWVAHQRIIGFRTIIVVTNDCTDGTDDICDALAAHDPDFIHVKSQLNPDDIPQIKGMEQVFALPIIEKVDYLLHCDADEFLNIDCGTGQVSDLISETGEPDCIALAWRPFGDAGQTRWTGGFVTEKCTRSAGFLRPSFTVHKSLFSPKVFGGATDHMPKKPTKADITLVNSKGEAIPTRSLFHPRHARFRGTPPEKFTWEKACIFHYAIKSQDVFLMKNKRGDGMRRDTDRYHLNSKFWRRNNKNNVHVALTDAYRTSLLSVVEGYRSLGSLRKIERDAINDFQQKVDEYLTPEMIRRLSVTSG